jgi:hypothetical protein
VANHVRRQLRERAATTVTSLTTTGANVFQGRVYPVTQAQLPCLLVYTNAEEVETRTRPGGTQVRNLELVIEGKVRGADAEDTLDTIAKEVEVALYADRTLNSLAKDSTLVSTAVDLSNQGDHIHGTIRLTYQVTYTVAEGTPDAAT